MYYTVMLDAYKMVLINSIASLLLIAGILFYKYIYPKCKINLFILLLIISILPLISLLRAGAYESGDFNIHIYRIMSFSDSLVEGNFMPSWAAELNATYGNPLFIFNYSFSYYIISLFHFIGFSFIGGMKIFLGLNLFFSGIFMYIWIKELTGNKLAAFTSGIFYVFSPYHLIDVHFRATLGETTIFTFAPLLFYFITKYFRKGKIYYLILSSLANGILFLSHPLLAGVFTGIGIMYCIILSKNNKKLFFILISLFIGVFASMYTWISFSIYSSYMFHNPSDELSFYPFQFLFYSPWRYGFLFQGHQGELALIIGYAQILVIFISILLFIKNGLHKNIKRFYFFWLIIFILLLFFVHPFSKIVWNFFPGFWMLIPTGRLMLPIAFCTSVIAGYFTIAFSVSHTKRILINILIIIGIGSTILNWGHRKVIPEIDDKILRTGVWKSTVTEGVTAYFLNNKWADVNNFWFSELPKNHLEIIQGKGIIKQIKRTSIMHAYIINAETPITIIENTLYFPGWSLKSNYKQIAIYPGKRGIINAKLPQGLQYIELTYEDIAIYKLTKRISLGIFFSLIFILLISIIKFRKMSKKH